VLDNWPAIEAVAVRLMERKKLSGDEVAMIVARIPRGSEPGRRQIRKNATQEPARDSVGESR
jgi:hypothetical protein